MILQYGEAVKRSAATNPDCSFLIFEVIEKIRAVLNAAKIIGPSRIKNSLMMERLNVLHLISKATIGG